jgi:predicted alpha-1,6-mannanase (GH76 family)
MNNAYAHYANNGLIALQQWYDHSKGLWNAPAGWWNAANTLWLLADYAQRANVKTYHPLIETTFNLHKGKNFLNWYYDDEGWWGLAWIKAYDLVGDTRYLVMAQTIFADMVQGWDTQCGGGIWWSKDRTYKNAIANELFLTLAARLAQRVNDEHQSTSYLSWADQEWNWFAQSGMINTHNLINDGLNNACQNNNGPTWTYNQGVILGGLVDRYKLTRDASYLKRAEAIADAVLSTQVDSNGILHEPGEQAGDTNADRPQFKGIFMRNLAYLYETDKNATYKQFIVKNAESIIHNNSNNAFQFGLVWSGPLDSADATRQTSALDAIVAGTFLD